MCGIAGFIMAKDKEIRFERAGLLDAMCRIITHRGPDEQGTVVRGRAALGMRRLSIIDLKTGQQPIFSADGRFAIIFNGEIYNYRELKAELEERGHEFKTNSDTETILHSFVEYGSGCVERLRGMFAFAIWDFEAESLFLARDRVGKKPLFYALADDGSLVFGSELKSLMLYPGISHEIDLESIDTYLTFGYLPESQCIFRSVNKLTPGHMLEFRNGKIKTSPYWEFPCASDSGLNETEIAAELRDLVHDAVNVRMLSEVPLGAFLSGGVDSSIVVAMMSKISVDPVKTFSIGFNEDSYSELKFARLAAEHFKTDHHEFIVTPDLVEVVDDIVWHFDEPFADSSALPTYMVSKLAREHVTVVLSGDGGDELFGGYTRYTKNLGRSWASKLPSFIRRSFGRLSRALPNSALGKNYLYNISLDPIPRYIDALSLFNRPNRNKLYSQSMLNALDSDFGIAEEEFQDISRSCESRDSISPMLRLDSLTYLPSDVMVKVDRMTMANSIEARAPLLDHKLIEFASRIPPTMKVKGSETKYILKKAFEGIVPHEILYREKQGFGVPIEEWINSELRERINDTLLDSTAMNRGYFDRSYIELILKEHADRRRDHSHSLWALFMLELWHREFTSNNGLQGPII